jgi:hypothetical protein
MMKKGRAVAKKSRHAGQIRPTPNYHPCGVGIPDGFTQKEWELKSKYPEESDLIAKRIAQEREKDIPDLNGVEDEIRRRRKRPKYNSGKGRGKRV